VRARTPNHTDTLQRRGVKQEAKGGRLAHRRASGENEKGAIEERRGEEGITPRRGNGLRKSFDLRYSPWVEGSWGFMVTQSLSLLACARLKEEKKKDIRFGQSETAPGDGFQAHPKYEEKPNSCSGSREVGFHLSNVKKKNLASSIKVYFGVYKG